MIRKAGLDLFHVGQIGFGLPYGSLYMAKSLFENACICIFVTRHIYLPEYELDYAGSIYMLCIYLSCSILKIVNVLCFVRKI